MAYRIVYTMNHRFIKIPEEWIKEAKVNKMETNNNSRDHRKFSRDDINSFITIALLCLVSIGLMIFLPWR